MFKKIFTFFSIFLFLSGTNFPLNASNKSSKNFSSKINIDFLKIIPENDYIIGPGDQLEIIVSRFYPELTSRTLVDGEGTIYISKLNRIFVDGLTINELNDLLNEAYKEFVKFPDVEVAVMKYRPIKVFVEGEVENPGLQIINGSYSLDNLTNSDFNQKLGGNRNREKEIYFDNNMASNISYFPTVFDAIRSSGGITQFTDLSEIQIIRKNNLSDGGGQIETKVNFQEVISFGDNTQNIRIYDGDIIKLKKTNQINLDNLQQSINAKLSPKFLNVFVSGRVKLPGNTTVSKASTLTDAIDIAGGAFVLKGPVTFLRFNNDGTIDKRKFNFKKRSKRGSYSNPYLRNGDLIIVGESLLSTTNQIISEFTGPFVGVFSTYGLIKAIQD